MVAILHEAAMSAYLVPEPATASRSLLGLAGLVMRRRRRQEACPCASASLLFRKLFEEIREKIILPVFIFPDYFSENFEWGFKTAGLFLHLPVHVPMGNS